MVEFILLALRVQVVLVVVELVYMVELELLELLIQEEEVEVLVEYLQVALSVVLEERELLF